MSFELDVLKSGLRVAGLNIKYVEETGSTNADLLADAGAGHGTVLIAGAQTAGRGRMSRRFASPEGGLYISVLLHPANTDDALLVTPRAAVATAMAIERITGRSMGIKWVNDVFDGDRKVSGTLTEAVVGEVLSVVVGTGVNVAEPPGGFPEELRGVAAGLYPYPAPEFTREKLAAEMLNGLLAPDYDLYAEYTRRCIVLGRDVVVHRGAEAYPARALAIDECFRLVVERPDGSREALDSGEVSVRL